jgi:hypothetical protein
LIKDCGFGNEIVDLVNFSRDVVARSVLEQPIAFSRYRNRYPHTNIKKGLCLL